ncbi:MAG TPA: Holliday junction resolvase RuvX [Candidatus Binatia bacterium]|nr:Holliday junction resolvase RuvX [Candidatus Binatia bacterium]
MSGRLAALDVGDKRIGVALSDPLRLIAQPVGVVERKGARADCSAILALLAEHKIEKVIVGLPLSFSGSEGEQADRVRHFAERFHSETGLPVVYQDERLTTVQGERMLVQAGVRRDRRRRVVDKVAAALILQAYLDSQPREPL